MDGRGPCEPCDKSVAFWAAAPKGPMTYAFTQGEIFSSFFSSSFSSSFSVTPSFELKLQPQAQITVSSLNPRLRAQIPTLWLKSQLHRSYSNLLAQIPALWLKLQPSIGHQFLQDLLISQIPPPPSSPPPPSFGLKSPLRSSNPSLKAQISVSRLKSQPRGSNPSP